MERTRDQLEAAFGGYANGPRLDPISQLVKSLISGRTKDAVSLKAYEQLVRRYERWSHIAAIPPAKLEKTIEKVTFAEKKAEQLVLTLKQIAACRPDFVLDFFYDWPVGQALQWLERLPGVGRKVAAATLNFSTLRRPAFVVDTHVLRVLGRLGFVDARATTEQAYDGVMVMTMGWSADDLTHLHSLMKRLGQLICRPTHPLCGFCPIGQDCRNRLH